MIAGNLCRCTGYQNIVAAVLRAAELPPRTGDESHDHASCSGERVQRVEDERLPARPGPLRRRRARRAGRARRRGAPRRRTPTPGSSTSTSTAVLDLEGVHAVWTYDDLDRPDGRAAAAADPAPGADPRPHAVRAGQGRGQLRRRGDRLRGRRRPLRRRGRRRPDPGRPTSSCRRWSASRRPGPPTHLVHDDVPGNVGARMEQNIGDAPAAIAAAPHRLSLDLTIERSACMPMEGRGTVARWDPDTGRLQVWTSTQTSTGVRAARRREAGPRPRPGRRDHPRRRAAASASRSTTRGPRSCSCRWRRARWAGR